jgi:predicted DNA-binding protein
MPSKNPRVNVVLDDHLFRNVQLLAKREGVSLSTKVRDLVKEALEIQEDLYLASFAETRERTFKKSVALSHEETWS